MGEASTNPEVEQQPGEVVEAECENGDTEITVAKIPANPDIQLGVAGKQSAILIDSSSDSDTSPIIKDEIEDDNIFGVKKAQNSSIEIITGKPLDEGTEQEHNMSNVRDIRSNLIKNAEDQKMVEKTIPRKFSKFASSER